jgi:hypothetical protein
MKTEVEVASRRTKEEKTFPRILSFLYEIQ